MLLIHLFVVLLFVSINNGSVIRTSSNFFDEYRKYNQIMNYLKILSDNYPNFVSVRSIGSTIENREIPLVIISIRNGVKKPIILIDGGMHSREWLSITTPLYIIYKLIQEENRYLLEDVEWHIMPLLNPDGYVFTHTSKSRVHRYWRKNRSKTSNNHCTGVDINRNFDFFWGSTDSNMDPCQDTYPGPYPFSEKESQHFKNHTTTYKDLIRLYVNLHSYGNIIAFPNAYKTVRPNNYRELLDLAIMVVKSIRKYSGTFYAIGMISQVVYPASGVSCDWVKNILNVPLSYIIELPSGGWSGFNAPVSFIKPIGEEIFVAFKIFHEYVVNTTYSL